MGREPCTFLGDTSGRCASLQRTHRRMFFYLYRSELLLVLPAKKSKDFRTQSNTKYKTKGQHHCKSIENNTHSSRIYFTLTSNTGSTQSDALIARGLWAEGTYCVALSTVLTAEKMPSTKAQGIAEDLGLGGGAGGRDGKD